MSPQLRAQESGGGGDGGAKGRAQTWSKVAYSGRTRSTSFHSSSVMGGGGGAETVSSQECTNMRSRGTCGRTRCTPSSSEHASNPCVGSRKCARSSAPNVSPGPSGGGEGGGGEGGGGEGGGGVGGGGEGGTAGGGAMGGISGGFGGSGGGVDGGAIGDGGELGGAKGFCAMKMLRASPADV